MSERSLLAAFMMAVLRLELDSVDLEGLV
jgi:hypothetical protein